MQVCTIIPENYMDNRKFTTTEDLVRSKHNGVSSRGLDFISICICNGKINILCNFYDIKKFGV